MSDAVSVAAGVCTRALDRLEAINRRLSVLECEIKLAQPKASGAIVLSFSTHRKTCMGCPHPVWKRWQSHRRNKAHPWQAHRVLNPLQRLPRSAKNAHLRALVAEVLALESTRSVLVSHLSGLEKALRFSLPTEAPPSKTLPKSDAES